jgi:hypothetical protein
MNPLLKPSLTRITTAIRPQTDVIKDFVTTKTFLNGRRFSTDGHEYQDLLMEELVDPDVNFVLYKVAQAGASEVIYRILLAYCATIPGFSTALILPSLEQTREVMKVRIDNIISSSPTLREMMDSSADSSALKRMRNGSVIYGLSGSGTSKSTTISRPIRCLVVDEMQFINVNTVTSMAARQRHQLHKATIYFSSPRYANSDIDYEIQNCGHIWQSILKCSRCNHEFFPSYYDPGRVPGVSDPLQTITLQKVSALDLNLEETYLECPKCRRKIPYGPPHTHWVNVAETPNLPKRGMKIGPFDIPKFVSCANLVQDMVRMADRDEFSCQFLAIPISHSANSLDITQIKFENEEPGPVNVFGLDIGKQSCLTIGSVSEGRLYIHYIEFLPLRNIRETLPQILKEYRCVAGVIDLMPYTELTAHFINTIPNTWASVYSNNASSAKKLELFTLKHKIDDAVGAIRVINVNMTPTFDYFADQISNGLITYKSSHMDAEVTKQLSVMSRQRDYSAGTIDDNQDIVYRWRKPNTTGKVDDHLHHSSIYVALASKVISKSRYQTSLSPGSYLSSFKLKSQV